MFEPGNQYAVGNGRPKKPYSITETLKKAIKAQPRFKMQLIAKVQKMALQGDATAIKLIWGYLDGMPQQDITSGGESIIPHVALSTLRPKSKQVQEPVIEGIVDSVSDSNT